MDDLITTHGVSLLKKRGNMENHHCRIRQMHHQCLGGQCSKGGRKLADLKESLFGTIMADHPLCRSFIPLL